MDKMTKKISLFAKRGKSNGCLQKISSNNYPFLEEFTSTLKDQELHRGEKGAGIVRNRHIGVRLSLLVQRSERRQS